MVLAHLSKKNNLPELALLSAQRALEERSGLRNRQTRLELAEADQISKTYRLLLKARSGFGVGIGIDIWNKAQRGALNLYFRSVRSTMPVNFSELSSKDNNYD